MPFHSSSSSLELEPLGLSSSTPPIGADHVCPSVHAAVQLISEPLFNENVESIFVLGGSEVYKVRKR